MATKENSSSQISILEEKINFLVEQNRLKDIIMKYQEEKIEFLEKKIKELETKNNVEIKTEKSIKKIPSGNTITCHNKFKGGEYILGSYKYHADEKIDDKRNKISGHNGKNQGQNWIFSEISEGNYNITYADNFHDLLNWKIYSDGNEVILSKDKSSLFTLLKVEGKEEEKCFYIQDYNSKRFLYLTFYYRDGDSFFIGLSDKINQEEKERFIFYYS